MDSPLEELSEAYKCSGVSSLKEEWDQNVLDDIKNKTLYIVPAGFSQRNSQGRTRKMYYKSAYQKAITFETEKKLFPLGKNTHTIILQPEPQNKYDKHAIKIGVRFDDYGKTPQWFKPQIWQEIGYIPKVISKLLSKNFKMLRHGQILSLHAIFEKDLYFGRICIPYGEPEEENALGNHNVKRYNAILED